MQWCSPFKWLDTVIWALICRVLTVTLCLVCVCLCAQTVASARKQPCSVCVLLLVAVFTFGTPCALKDCPHYSIPVVLWCSLSWTIFSLPWQQPIFTSQSQNSHSGCCWQVLLPCWFVGYTLPHPLVVQNSHLDFVGRHCYHVSLCNTLTLSPKCNCTVLQDVYT